MTRIFDISLPVHPDMVVWPGDPRVEMRRLSKIEDGDICNVTHLSTAVHAGTHVDAPYHFLKDGTTVETLALDLLVGLAQVVQIPDQFDVIDRKAVMEAGILQGIVRVLFKTRNVKIRESGSAKFDRTFVAVSAEGAEALLEMGVKLVGVDYLSVAPFNNSQPPHEILLNEKVILLEGIVLDDVEPGLYTLCCLPIKLVGSDGAPARTILIQD